MSLGRLVFRFRWAVLSAWVVAVGLLLWMVPPSDPIANEMEVFLPEDTAYLQAANALRESFPGNR